MRAPLRTDPQPARRRAATIVGIVFTGTPMEAEQLNQIESEIADLRERVSALRGYL